MNDGEKIIGIGYCTIDGAFSVDSLKGHINRRDRGLSVEKKYLGKILLVLFCIDKTG